MDFSLDTPLNPTILPPDILKWQCRRGMLELDLLLNLFLEEAYPLLSSADQIRFAQLLKYPDTTLYYWLLENNKNLESMNEDLYDIIHRIRVHARLA